MPLGPPVEVSSGSGEGHIRVVCYDGSGISLGRLHGRGHAARGLRGPLWILKVVISGKVSVSDATILSRANRAMPLGCP